MRVVWLFAACLVITACAEGASEFGIAADDIQSGSAFLTPETRAAQDDDFANPGLLWVELGAALFEAGETACASCHEDLNTLGEAAAHYPAVDDQSGRIINLEGRINLCRRRHQDEAALPYESEDLLSLTSFVLNQAKDAPIPYDVTPANRAAFDRGAAYFNTRRGQFNLSCAQCHDRHWGQSMRGDTVSQGHINGFPAYRNDWQTLGSAHRRFEACDIGVRAEPRPLGHADYIALEVYLKARGSGLVVETPALRR